MDFFDVVTTQRAIRRLKPDPIPDSMIRQILDAAVCAPSGGNRQGWTFLVIRDPAKRTRLGQIYREAFEELLKTIPHYRDAALAPPDSSTGRLMASARHLAEHLAEAPVLVLACIATDGAKPTLATGGSIYPAVQNLMLAARALEIGSCLTTVHRFREPQVRELLGIPAEIETAALIPLGYPLGKFGRPPRRPVTEVTFVDHWGQAPAW
jgi:nitroreductase